LYVVAFLPVQPSAYFIILAGLWSRIHGSRCYRSLIMCIP